MRLGRKGFTLAELIVVILLIGILAAFGVPQYLKVLENSKAENAAALVNMIGTANRMYALDHAGALCGGAITNACNTPAACVGNGSTPCDLINCKYVGSMDWNNLPYTYSVGVACGAGLAACAARRTSGTSSTGTAPYNGWGYNVTTDGLVNPQPCAGSPGCPPTPTQ